MTDYDTTNIKVQWYLPYTGGNGIQILSYDLLFKKADGTLIHYLPNCDGADPTVVSNRYCLIPMSDVTGSTFGLAQGGLL